MRENVCIKSDRHRRLGFVVVALALPLAAAGGNQSLPQAPAGFSAQVQAVPLKATVGDPIQIDLDFTLPPGYSLRFPSLPPSMGEFAILKTYPGPTVPPRNESGALPAQPSVPKAAQKSETQHYQARIVAAVYKTGEFEFPGLPCVLVNAAGQTLDVPTPTIKVQIESVLSDKDKNLKDLKKQAEIPEPAHWLLWLGLAMAVLILALAVRRWLRRRPQLPAAAAFQPEADPFDVAEARLRALLERRLFENGQVKQFYVQLSEIAKKILEAGFGIQTVEKTTSEIISALVEPAPGNPDQRDPVLTEQIETLLLSCDMVKFARYLPSGAEKDTAVEQVRHIIQACRVRRQPAVQAAVPVAEVP